MPEHTTAPITGVSQSPRASSPSMLVPATSTPAVHSKLVAEHKAVTEEHPARPISPNMISPDVHAVEQSITSAPSIETSAKALPEKSSDAHSRANTAVASPISAPRFSPVLGMVSKWCVA